MPSGPNEARQILQVQNLTKKFAGVTALKDVSFDLQEGEVQ
jgi:ABC-type sugar transport system ATPase subunit